jgi:hypothetical protein
MKKAVAAALLRTALTLTPVFASADAILVSVDTSSLAGMGGNLDFQFAPGVPTPLPATATIYGFTGGAVSGAPTTFGSVTGSLPGSLIIDNSAAGDYFQPFTYGDSLSFTLVITEMPNPVLGGNTFAFSMFDSATPLHPMLTTNLVDGFAFEVFTPTVIVNFSHQTTLIVAVPEPASGALLLLGIAGAFGLRRFTRKNEAAYSRMAA